MPHQHYLEQLSFEAQSLSEWTRMIADQINDERERAHNQLANILDSLSQVQQVNAWIRVHPGQVMGPRLMAPPPPHPQMGSMQMPMQPQNQTL